MPSAESDATFLRWPVTTTELHMCPARTTARHEFLMIAVSSSSAPVHEPTFWAMSSPEQEQRKPSPHDFRKND